MDSTKDTVVTNLINKIQDITLYDKQEENVYELIRYACVKGYVDIIDKYFEFGYDFQELAYDNADKKAVYYLLDRFETYHTERHDDYHDMIYFVRYGIKTNDMILLNKIIYIDVTFITMIIFLSEPSSDINKYYKKLCRNICFCVENKSFVHIVKNGKFHKIRNNRFIIENDNLCRKGTHFPNNNHICTCNVGTNNYIVPDFFEY
jgi:hypothetical protein